ncbi:hypothetical protein MUP77_21770 [Candidatus Bathyarchaeota archaeon]|nr:hypothetical protein [Candidatus Bathyarchaeota archaeon]
MRTKERPLEPNEPTINPWTGVALKLGRKGSFDIPLVREQEPEEEEQEEENESSEVD